jgi:uncharacterized phage protein (TIGR01671 family)
VRDIEFRGKDKGTNKWITGGYFVHYTRQLNPVGDDKYRAGEIVHLICQSGYADWNMPRQVQMFSVIPETVGQYTGLKDKNGVKIFEGDIVAWQKENMVIRWNKKEGCFEVDNYYKFEALIEFKVIGNIHDNPELVTRK